MSKEAGYTAGPWYASTQLYMLKIHVSAGGEYDAPGAVPVAFCGEGLQRHTEMQANARLISAAPDLYEAGKRLSELADQIWVGMSESETARMREAWKAMDAALSKVEGGGGRGSAGVSESGNGAHPIPSEAPVSAGGWLTIDTAPSDGRPILTFGGRRDEVTREAADGSYWRSWVGGPVPTHWMPLPEPPSHQSQHSDGEG